MTEITSLHNPRVKAAVRLRHARQRQRQRRIVVDGRREVGRALDAGVELLEVFFCEPLCASEDARELVKRLCQSGVELLQVSGAVLEKLAFGQRSEGLVAVAAAPDASLARLAPPENALLAVLEGVEKPGNLGAVLRSADAAGLDAVLLADPRTDLFNPNAIRASLGTIFTVPVAEGAGDEVLQWLRDRNVAIYAARVDGTLAYTEADFRAPAAIVLGGEAEGLSPAWHAADVTPIRLPMLGAADSLNVSAAAAVLFYEALRQREGGRGME